MNEYLNFLTHEILGTHLGIFLRYFLFLIQKLNLDRLRIDQNRSDRFATGSVNPNLYYDSRIHRLLRTGVPVGSQQAIAWTCKSTKHLRSTFLHVTGYKDITGSWLLLYLLLFRVEPWQSGDCRSRPDPLIVQECLNN
jgi:hypothetical protein